MKKFLPKSAKNPQGFTLVELLVVVSIIAILAVVGLTVFGSVQKNARDVRRQSDIEAIAKAMETNYSETTGRYVNLAASMFSGGVIPTDPLSGSSNCGARPCKYCSRSAAGECLVGDPTVGAAVPAAGTLYYVCTNLETTATPTFYCRSNQR